MISVTSAETDLPRRRRDRRALLAALRPKQWLKNVLVLSAPAAAGVLFRGSAPWQVALSFLSFCAVASGAYLVNDAHDLAEDRRHPVKRHRPLARGALELRDAKLAAIALTAFGLSLALAVRWTLLLVLLGYLGMTLAYTFWLKHVPILDIAVIASGFVLRTVAGGVAVNVPISRWFLFVVSFGAVFVVSGKRYREHLALGPMRGGVRVTLATYSVSSLRRLYVLSGVLMVVGYGLWALGHARDGSPWLQLSVFPLGLAVLRYAILLEHGSGEAPEEVFFADRLLQLIGLVWAITFAVGIHPLR